MMSIISGSIMFVRSLFFASMAKNSFGWFMCFGVKADDKIHLRINKVLHPCMKGEFLQDALQQGILFC